MNPLTGRFCGRRIRARLLREKRHPFSTEQMKKQYRKALLIVAAFVTVALLYVPFRLFAQRFNTVFPGFVDRATGELSGSDNFYHWFSVLVWPAYSLVSGLLPMFVAKFLRVRWWFLIPVFIITFTLWTQITALDDWFNIPGDGLSGFDSFPANYPGMNTPHISVILCPISFIVGAMVGTIGGHIVGKKTPAEDEAQDGQRDAVNRTP